MARISCKAKTTAGAECRAPAGLNGLCFFHANPDQARTLGQTGGRKNRSKLVEPLAAADLTAANLLNILAEAINGVRANKITPRAATALAQLCNASYRILPGADFEVRLARLERLVAERESQTPDTNPIGSGRQDETIEVAEESNEDTPGRSNGADGGNSGSSECGGS